MNSRQLQYAVWLAETGSFSLLAEKLNITQPALSKQILALEKELGVRLFDRNTAPVAPTAAGVHFLEEAKELLYREDRLLRSMEQFRSGEKGQLVIGTTPFRSAYLLPNVVKKVRERFPGVQVKLIEEGSDLLRKDAADGKFDFALVNLPVDDAVLDVQPIEADRLVLVLSKELLARFPRLQEGKAVDFRDCADLPFVVPGATQEMRILFEKLCRTAEIHPNIVVEVVGLTTAWEMACSGIAATLLPMQFVCSASAKQPLAVLELGEETYLRQPAVVVKRGQYISAYASYAMEQLCAKKE